MEIGSTVYRRLIEPLSAISVCVLAYDTRAYKPAVYSYSQYIYINIRLTSKANFEPFMISMPGEAVSGRVDE